MSMPPVLLLTGSHDLSTVAATQAALLEASAAASLQIDMRGVEAADVALVQLLLALDMRLRERGDRLECLASPAVREAFERCGAELFLN